MSVESNRLPAIESDEPRMPNPDRRANCARPPLMLVDQRLANQNGKIERARPLRLLHKCNSKPFYSRRARGPRVAVIRCAKQFGQARKCLMSREFSHALGRRACDA